MMKAPARSKIGFGLIGLVALVALVLGAVILLAAACSKPEQPAAPGPSAPSRPEQTPIESEVARVDGRAALIQIADVSGSDLARFDHDSEAHKKLACGTCHVRKDNRTASELPEHPACIQCHSNIFTDQAFDQRRAFCEGCHLWPVEPIENRLASFPVEMKQFGLRAFSHRDHMDSARMPAGRSLQCETCHRPARGRLQFDFPGHAECYSCHTHDSKEPSGECGVCHGEKDLSIAYRSRARLAFTDFRFDHRTHLNEATIAGDCAQCHRSLPDAGKVDISGLFPGLGMTHSSQCWSCHEQAQEYSCLKCHAGGPPVSLTGLFLDRDTSIGP